MRNQSKVLTKRAMISACLIMIVNGCASKTHHELPSLKQAFKNSFYIGAALNQNQLMGREKKSMDLVKRQFSSITPEDILKWSLVHPEPGKYNFAPVDSFVAFGERNEMFIIGHNLVWHNQIPEWVFKDDSGNLVNRETLLQRMHDHIFTVVGRYKGRINGWDVVNEAIEDDGQLRKSKWLEIIGEDYLQKAFEWAHEADPSTELYYNDYNMWYAGKREGVVRIIGDLLAKGVPVHGIGMQGHWGLDYPPSKELEASINTYSKLGVKVMITELDLDILPKAGSNTGTDITMNKGLQKKLNPYADGLPDSIQEKLMARYAELFSILDKHRDKIARVTFWGVHDGVSWLNHSSIRGRTAYPLLFDRKLQPKPAFDAVLKTAGK